MERNIFKLHLIFFLVSTLCSANVSDHFGMGSRSSSLGGHNSAWGFDGYAANANPAAASLPTNERLQLSWGMLGMGSNFKPIKGVLTSNDHVSDQYTRGEVDTGYKPTIGHELGLIYTISPKWNRLAFGVSTFFPVAHIGLIDTGETYQPEYVLYRARTQRPQIDFSLSVQTSPKLLVGFGARIGYSLDGTARVYLQTNASKPSSMRFSGSLKPKIAPTFGILWIHNEGPAKNWQTSGFVLRAPIKSTAEIRLITSAGVFNGFPALDFNFNATSALFYDPWSIEAGHSLAYSDQGRIYFQVEHQLWKMFESPAVAIQDPSQNCSNGSCGVKISPGKNPRYDLKNTWIGRLGHEWNFSSWTLRSGYSYREGIFKSAPNEAGNYLDPTQHILALGAGLKFNNFLNFQTPCNLDFHFAYHRLNDVNVQKTSGDEAGLNGGERKIGAPGYVAGGYLLGGGMTLTLGF